MQTMNITTKKRGFALFVAIMMALTLWTAMPLQASAATMNDVPYIDEFGTLQYVDNVTVITSETNELTAGWYIVNDTVTYDAKADQHFARVMVSATEASGGVHLILADNCEYIISGGMSVNNDKNLTIYAQSTGDSMGKLKVNPYGYNEGYGAGIGGDSQEDDDSANNGGGTITINGGFVYSFSYWSAGIGGGGGENPCTAQITINGGVVNASSNYGAGIGSGIGSYSLNAILGNNAEITINGGTVNAYSGYEEGGGSGSAIGGGCMTSAGTIVINGGTVRALCQDQQSTNPTAIGAGSTYGLTTDVQSGSITINGGTVTALMISDIGSDIPEPPGSGIGGVGSPTLNITNAIVFTYNVSVSEENVSNALVVVDGTTTFYGSDEDENTVTLDGDNVIPEDQTLTIPEGKTLTVAEGGTLTVDEGAEIVIEENGKLNVESGGTVTVEDSGAINIDGGGSLNNAGTIDGEGDIVNNGTINNTGSIADDIASSGSGAVITAPAITTTSLPGGTFGSTYSGALTADNGGGEVVWTIDSGNWPNGLALEEATGKISGVPAKSGTFTFTVKATNSAGSVTKELSITIVPVPSQPTQYTLTVNNGDGGGNYAEGTTVSITANAPASGKVFDTWTTTDGVTFADASKVATSFVMPAKAVTVTATYKDDTVNPPVNPPTADNGWVYENGVWKFFKDGKAATGWLHDGKAWYYLGSDGEMQTGWVYDQSKWYYLAGNGAMKIGWVQTDGSWYYLSGNGAMVAAKWFNDTDGSWYYLSGNGKMLTGKQNIGGKTYSFKANGVWIG